MTIRIACNHLTCYKFDRPVGLSPHVFRLRPAPHSRTPIKGYSLRIHPEQHFLNWQQDPFGNYLARVVFPEKTRELRIEVEVVADMTVINPFDFFIEESAEKFPFAYDPQLRKELAPYFEIEEEGPLLRQWLAKVDRSEKGTVDFLVEINREVWKHVQYSVRLEPGVQSCEETLGRAVGSCRDSGWLLVQILRHLGLAARFVSGYLVQLTADEKSLDGPSGPEADFTDLHAWAEVFVPGAGWVGLDPTSGLFAGEGHIPLACTPHPASAAPVSGATEKTEVRFEFSNSVQRIHEDPRVTKPYSDDQWALIDALGQQVDEDLAAGDVRLTMGGEPTFVSIDDMEGPEWTTRADGPHKRKLAYDLILRLREVFGPGGLLHFGQGKWYPGEPLPRWSYACFWRKDGAPLWRNPRLLADITRDYGVGGEQARRFAGQLARRLGVNPRHLTAGYEDLFYYLWKEGTLPHNVDPLKADLKDPLERRYLAQLLDKGMGEPTGFALPLKWDFNRQRWQSGPWEFRRGQMFLIPGNSAMGMRLPLDSLPWVAPEKRETQAQHDLFGPLPELGDAHGEVARRYSHIEPPEPVDQEPPRADEPASGDPVEVPHTAVCIEAREGRLHVFLPPLGMLEHYLDLVASIEASAEELDLPVVIEGYEAPRDWRIERLLVTPDPGVIEVNIHPAASWRELERTTTTLYEQARLSRLGTEKFMLDGRHTGTGGGNHITIGAATPADSPVLRRPDLLRSLITYWQHHPGLSYLFSGMFIGPTSQAPRVDEGRDDILYELEIAFQQMPEGEVPAPWLVDRLLRNLLVDITGNTHRAEFCIDKLYSPDSTTGRLGLVELRAFEMPPHARMSLVQTLLLRTLIAWFWKQPYKHPLVRWGTELHDRFLLPHYVREDLQEVAADLQRAGYPFQLEWLEPFFEFRFPHYGTVRVDNLELELRFAIEPWHVLGEEVSNLGTARFVDSSVERLQLRVTGLTESRHLITCNGRRLPLRSTGRRGEYVAGIRYRAWQPPSALHPTIKPHSPVVFDVVDTWNGRSIGGCTYHVSHPGGRSYDVFPVNAYEAESRRISRFWEYGHTPGPIQPPPALAELGKFVPQGSPPGPMAPPPEEPGEEFPYTLDLRRGPSR
ncbi:IMP dehydrogenase [Desulfuromonas versatilis]|uniref:IMP dehydrogenase n=1 Tax=Desulfuromonas versatilis TaxID=2802975 RepID=A0ABM8I2I7_9BACT|nr:transglutaminase family protein [Desulfuromonas versatilis]BCR07018.1 IMP dehydrogenase [Desulfuromonas versatilis]